ncbi:MULTISPECIES: hypothetical protein [unclassified Nocardia]|uniref:hypothetical protein n=1 Tax=unclassified Nocardia TaxID=2637762 RepID=UPI001CE459CF|nr:MULTISPECIES: hypothetical protein [unclassified Nocardia]
MALPTSAEIAPIVAWTGQHQGQTVDSNHSFATVQCDDSKTLFVSGHLFKTNLPNQQFHAYYKLDGGAPVSTSSTVTSSADGTVDFAFSVEGMASGTHAVGMEINHLPDNLTYYMDTSTASGGKGVPFTCP